MSNDTGAVLPADTSPDPSDDDVLARVRGGDIDSFEIVMRRYNQRVYRTVRAILRDEDEALDVMQEAYVNAFAHLAEFSGRARFSTWLTRIAVHEAFARLRKRKRVESLDDTESEELLMASPVLGPENRASDGELRTLLEEAVDGLPEAFRTTFVLRSVEQLSVAETAEVLGIPEETVKTRLHRARERLQSSLSNRVGDTLPELFGFHRPRCDRVVANVLSRLRERQLTT
ncbi:MAG TPA: RNA polymerase sigma factor [Polyangiaceae bacterium]|nr:RNA polymerase sigma factor [Polyangiaceae bacterium]